MRLSDIENTDLFLDKICEITPYVKEISCEKELIEAIKRGYKTILNDSSIKKDKDLNENGLIIANIFFEKGLGFIFDFIPVLFKKHRNAIYGIISSLNEISIEEVAKQKPKETIKQVKELFTDKEFLNLFL